MCWRFPGDSDAKALPRLAKELGDGDQTRRLLAMAAVSDGVPGDAAEIGGVGLQTVRDWVLQFNAEGPAGLVNGKAPGSRPLPGEVERAPLRRIAEEGPTTSVHVVMRWRFVDLMQWVSRSSGSRSAFKSTSARTWRRSRREVPGRPMRSSPKMRPG